MIRFFTLSFSLVCLVGCSTHRESGCCDSASVGGASAAASQPASGGGRTRESNAPALSGSPRKRGETVTDSTQESRVLGVEAVVGGDAELRR
jgi:hypothetical protein